MKLLQDLLRESAKDTVEEGPKNLEDLVDDLCSDFDIEYISIREKANGDVRIDLDGWWYEEHRSEFLDFMEALQKSPMVSGIEQQRGDKWLVVKKK